MFCGTILLTKDNYYVGTSSDKLAEHLPHRPKHDKLLLSEMCKGQVVSDDAYNMLPLSIQKLITVGENPTIPITIQELANCQLLIVSRSIEEFLTGKKFRLDNFKLIVKDRKIEIWSKI